MTEKRLREWTKWALEHLDEKRGDAFLQGWRSAFAIMMAHDGIPGETRKTICSDLSLVEARLWKAIKGLRRRR